MIEVNFLISLREDLAQHYHFGDTEKKGKIIRMRGKIRPLLRRTIFPLWDLTMTKKSFFHAPFSHEILIQSLLLNESLAWRL